MWTKKDMCAFLKWYFCVEYYKCTEELAIWVIKLCNEIIIWTNLAAERMMRSCFVGPILFDYQNCVWYMNYKTVNPTQRQFRYAITNVHKHVPVHLVWYTLPSTNFWQTSTRPQISWGFLFFVIIQWLISVDFLHQPLIYMKYYNIRHISKIKAL